MGRWEPNAEERLRAAALELFDEHGYEQTTVSEIAQRAGLTARTFFRYFADKREVLFAGSEQLQQGMVAAITAMHPAQPPMAGVAAALDVAAEMLGQRREFSRARQAVIDANPELLERELIKLSRLAAAMATALRERGVEPAEAGLAAESGVAVLRVAFQVWAEAAAGPSLGETMNDCLERLRGLSAAR